MCNTRCPYCGRFVQSTNASKRCAECERQFKEVMSNLTRKYDGALKGLAER